MAPAERERRRVESDAAEAIRHVSISIDYVFVFFLSFVYKDPVSFLTFCVCVCLCAGLGNGEAASSGRRTQGGSENQLNCIILMRKYNNEISPISSLISSQKRY